MPTEWSEAKLCAGDKRTVGSRNSDLGRCLGSARCSVGSMMRRMSQNFTTSSLSPVQS